MGDNSGKVEEILDELELEGGNETESQESSSDRLRGLHDAGAITDEEYEVIRAHVEDEKGGDSTSESPKFGTPIATSEGKSVDFSIVGVFEEIDTTELVMPEFAENLDEDDLPPQYKGGPGRSIICWQIHNHGNEQYELSHDDLEQIGADGIAYNQGDNPLQEEKFKPGWRTEDWTEIAPDTRIKYASCIEIPVQLTSVKIGGYQIGDHEIEITDGMRFPKSDLPAKVDL
jgi:hypothetical protein